MDFYLSFLDVALDLPELGEVEGGDLLRLLNLLLVAADLALKRNVSIYSNVDNSTLRP